MKTAVVRSFVLFSLVPLCAAAQGPNYYASQNIQREHDAYINKQTEINSRYYSNPTYPTFTSPTRPSARPARPVKAEAPVYLSPSEKMLAAAKAQQAKNATATRSSAEAFAEYQSGALRGDAQSTLLLAQSYYWGEGTTQDKPRAYATFRSIAATVPKAEAEAAAMLIGGDGIPADPAQGIALLRHAAASGDPTAKTWLASVDPVLTPSFVEAQAARKDYVTMTNYGVSLLYGSSGVPKDEAKGLAYIKRAADAGDAFGAYAYSLALRDGDGTPVDLAKAIEYARKAAVAGFPGSAHNLVVLLSRPGPQRNLAEAHQWAEKAVEQRPTAAHELQQLAAVELLQKDLPGTRTHLSKAVQMGDTIGLLNLGSMEVKGEGGPLATAEGLRHLERAGELGNPKGYDFLGNIYGQGMTGVPQDLKKAVTYLERASDMGYAESTDLLATIYFYGMAGPKDFTRAAGYAQKAADGGNAHAAFLLAQLYAQGDGIPKDPAKALEWMKKSSAAGSEEARAELAKGFTGR